MPGYHLAQVNIARLLAPLDSPELAGFVASLEGINAVADGSPGFVWRLQTDGGDATSIRAFDDEWLLVNLSVWESLETLRDFVYQSRHVEVLRRRREWFERLADVHLALWWLPAGELPTVDEAKRRLDLVQHLGPTPDAFTFRSPFEPPAGSGRLGPAVDAEFCWTA